MAPTLLQAFAKLEGNPDFREIVGWIEAQRAEALIGLRAVNDLHALGTQQGRYAVLEEILLLARTSREHLRTRERRTTHDPF